MDSLCENTDLTRIFFFFIVVNGTRMMRIRFAKTRIRADFYSHFLSFRPQREITLGIRQRLAILIVEVQV
jgi:hypothetical protein